MKKIIFILIILFVSFVGITQTFCDTMFGRSFKLEIKIESITQYIFNFKNDTLDFYQYKPLETYYLFHLNCDDSSFRVSSCNDGIVSNTGDGFRIESYNFGNKGKWVYDSFTKIISFQLMDSTNWNHFKIITKGNKENNPYVH